MPVLRLERLQIQKKNKKKEEMMEYIVAMEKITKYIGISKKTEFEVLKKLQTLKLTPEDEKKIIKELKQLEYIDDALYVKLFIKQNINMKKYSKYEIKQKLLMKGIKKEKIDKEILLLDNNDYEAQVVKKVLNKKFKNYEDSASKAYLYRRGFKLEGLGTEND